MSDNWTVTKYLLHRLKQVGVRHLFGVPGDYVFDFVHAANEDGLEFIGNTNELNAGYAADGYARLNGVSAVAVTYGAGAFSLLNAIAGAYVERVPIIVVNGGPNIAQRLQDRQVGLLWHHMLNGQNNELEIYRRVTVSAQQIRNPALAPGQIDEAIISCLTHSRPIYLEMYQDIYAQRCTAPVGTLVASPVMPLPPSTGKSNLDMAIQTAAAKIRNSKQPIVWSGVELQRYHLEDRFETLLEETGLLYVASLLGKSVLSEENRAYIGVFEGVSSNVGVQPIIGASDCLIGLGVLTADINMVYDEAESGAPPWGDDFILAADDSVRVGTAYFPQVALGDFLDGLARALVGYHAPRIRALPADQEDAPAGLVPASRLTFDNFFWRMRTFVDDSMMVLADVGFASFGAMNLKISQRSGFICQAAYAAIGYAAAATLGAKFARPELRPIAFAGDGAFQMTCQVISTMIKARQNPVIFVMNNGVYGIEQLLVDGKIFAGNDPGAFDPANILHGWHYSKLTDVFGGRGWRVETLAELDTALAEITAATGELCLVDVCVETLSFPKDLASFT